MPTEVPKHTLALSSMAIRLCLTSQGFSKDHEYFCFIIAFLFSGFWNLAAALKLSLSCRSGSLREQKWLAAASLAHTAEPTFPDCCAKDGRTGWELRGNLTHCKVSICLALKAFQTSPQVWCVWHHESLVARLNSQCAFSTPSISWVPVVFLFVAQWTPWGKSL